jgi:hypothetical protein
LLDIYYPITFPNLAVILQIVTGFGTYTLPSREDASFYDINKALPLDPAGANCMIPLQT